MLDFIYYPVSWILWFWHRVFGFAFGADNGLTWALAVVFLVFTLRLVLYKPFVKQAKQWLDEGLLGKLQFALCHMASPIRSLLQCVGH